MGTLCLFVAYQIALLAQGFAFTHAKVFPNSRIARRGWLQTATSILSAILGVALLITSVLERSVTLAVLTVVSHLLATGTGQTITLVAFGAKELVSVPGWVLSTLYIAAALYCILFGRVVTV